MNINLVELKHANDKLKAKVNEKSVYDILQWSAHSLVQETAHLISKLDADGWTNRKASHEIQTTYYLSLSLSLLSPIIVM